MKFFIIVSLLIFNFLTIFRKKNKLFFKDLINLKNKFLTYLKLNSLKDLKLFKQKYPDELSIIIKKSELSILDKLNNHSINKTYDLDVYNFLIENDLENSIIYTIFADSISKYDQKLVNYFFSIYPDLVIYGNRAIESCNDRKIISEFDSECPYYIFFCDSKNYEFYIINYCFKNYIKNHNPYLNLWKILCKLYILKSKILNIDIRKYLTKWI